ncbi:Piso0_005264 [Millerozyma farinosa CBS 7064]|uniref:Piso0_005264 protein n=1 Tax=Pichia sorbitophila (strain ATCC MYA-4447 / BCRC 22081 / CBS 7064 / NBRC 10061 / NRRL Y-12695) TaxID=559304 RepID=G8Y1Q1_PICSO|nr:Piso0_005264 [Millerozyma farinosa CBS 7064]
MGPLQRPSWTTSLLYYQFALTSCYYKIILLLMNLSSFIWDYKKDCYKKNSKNLEKYNAGIANDLNLIQVGKFKGSYDTRRFRCIRKQCHTSICQTNCEHCKYLPYTSSPLRYKNFNAYAETDEWENTSDRRSKLQNQLDNLASHMMSVLSDLVEDISDYGDSGKSSDENSCNGSESKTHNNVLGSMLVKRNAPIRERNNSKPIASSAHDDAKRTNRSKITRR